MLVSSLLLLAASRPFCRTPCSYEISFSPPCVVVINLLIIPSHYAVVMARITEQIQADFSTPLSRPLGTQWCSPSLHLRHPISLVTVLIGILPDWSICELPNSSIALSNDNFLNSNYLLICFHYKLSGLIRTSRQCLSQHSCQSSFVVHFICI